MPIPAALRAEICRLESPHTSPQSVLPFGITEIDAHLPGGGLKCNAYHECLGANDIHGEAAATLFVAGILARTQGPVLWCLRQQSLFAPALSQAGLAIDRIVFAEASSEQALLACFEEGLRHPGMAGVVGEINRISMTQSRRLQLAAEASGAIGIGIGRWHEKRSITSAHTCWRISMLPTPPLPVDGLGCAKWQLELMRCRGGEPGHFAVNACDQTGRM